VRQIVRREIRSPLLAKESSKNFMFVTSLNLNRNVIWLQLFAWLLQGAVCMAHPYLLCHWHLLAKRQILDIYHGVVWMSANGICKSYSGSFS
jgi:hypothetical protein